MLLLMPSAPRRVEPLYMSLLFKEPKIAPLELPLLLKALAPM